MNKFMYLYLYLYLCILIHVEVPVDWAVGRSVRRPIDCSVSWSAHLVSTLLANSLPPSNRLTIEATMMNAMAPKGFTNK